MNDLKVVDRTYKYLYKIDVGPRKKSVSRIALCSTTTVSKIRYLSQGAYRFVMPKMLKSI